MAVEDSVAGPLGLDPVAASSGILAIADSHMVNAIKLLSVQRGLDPRDFTLVAFGGCGPLHGAALADELGMDRVLVPAAPGNVSAMGLLAADVRYDVVRTRVAALDSLDPADLAAEFAALIEEGVAALARETVAEEDRRLVPAVDLRYRGQNYELTLPLPAEAAARPDIAALRERFHGEHRRAYGYDLPNRAIQLVNLRLSAIGVAAAFAWPRRPGTTHGAPVGERKVRLRDGATAAIPVYRLDDTAEGQRVPGPAMVEYPGATLFVPGAWEATFDAWRHAHLNRKDGDR